MFGSAAAIRMLVFFLVFPTGNANLSVPKLSKGCNMLYFFFPKDPALPKANVCKTLATLNVNCELAL
jgi:hypothetical protein